MNKLILQDVTKSYGGHPLLNHLSRLVEDLFTLWHITWLCTAFLFGILIKQQVISPLSQTLPGHRRVQLSAALVLLSAITFITFIWLFTMPGIIVAPQRGPLETLSILAFIITLILAYISVRAILLVGYTLALFAYDHVMDIYDMIVRNPNGLIILLAVMAVTVLLFGWRVWLIKDGMFEYSYLLAWPPHRSLTGGSGNTRRQICRWFSVRPFHSRRGLLNTAQHWSIVENTTLPGLAVLILAGVSAFEYFIFNVDKGTGFYAHPYNNLLLLTMVPLFFTFCFNYRLLAYGAYALTRPVSRENLFKQWGALLIMSLLSAWLLTITLFAIVPALILKLPLVHTLKFWLFLVFCGCFAQFTLCWLTGIASLKVGPKSIIQCLIYFLWLAILISTCASFNEATLLANIALTTAAGIYAGQKSYQQWCRKDVC